MLTVTARSHYTKSGFTPIYIQFTVTRYVSLASKWGRYRCPVHSAFTHPQGRRLSVACNGSFVIHKKTLTDQLQLSCWKWYFQIHVWTSSGLTSIRARKALASSVLSILSSSHKQIPNVVDIYVPLSPSFWSEIDIPCDSKTECKYEYKHCW